MLPTLFELEGAVRGRRKVAKRSYLDRDSSTQHALLVSCQAASDGVVDLVNCSPSVWSKASDLCA